MPKSTAISLEDVKSSERSEQPTFAYLNIDSVRLWGRYFPCDLARTSTGNPTEMLKLPCPYLSYSGVPTRLFRRVVDYAEPEVMHMNHGTVPKYEHQRIGQLQNGHSVPLPAKSSDKMGMLYRAHLINRRARSEK